MPKPKWMHFNKLVRIHAWHQNTGNKLRHRVHKQRPQLIFVHNEAFSAIWRCWLGGRKGIRPVKNWVVGCWRGCVWVKVQICIWPSWCHCHSLSLAPVNPDWFYLPGFTFLVPAHPGSLDKIQEGHKMVVCVILSVTSSMISRFFMQSSLLDFKINGICDGMNVIHLPN